MRTERSSDDDSGLRRALDVMKSDGVVAIPTETVYGLAGRALSERAIDAIYAAKGRPADNPLIVHIGDADDAWPLWRFSSSDEQARAHTLIEALWPGPLTIVAWASEAVPPVVRAGLPKVAVRLPAHPFAQQLAKLLGEPIAAPSANMSGRPSPTTADDVLATLDGKIPLVVDGGPCAQGIESSVVDITGERPRVLRPGAVSTATLRALLPDLAIRAAGSLTHDDASPGLRHRHYAPQGGAQLVTAVNDEQWRNERTAVIARVCDVGERVRGGPLLTLPDDVHGYSRELYAALYRAERVAAETLLVVDVPHDEAWSAVRDRLLRATA